MRAHHTPHTHKHTFGSKQPTMASIINQMQCILWNPNSISHRVRFHPFEQRYHDSLAGGKCFDGRRIRCHISDWNRVRSPNRMKYWFRLIIWHYLVRLSSMRFRLNIFAGQNSEPDKSAQYHLLYLHAVLRTYGIGSNANNYDEGVDIIAKFSRTSLRDIRWWRLESKFRHRNGINIR